VNTSYPLGSALGLAAMTALPASHGASRLSDFGALTDGYSSEQIAA
jgi:hypothetical protein